LKDLQINSLGTKKGRKNMANRIKAIKAYCPRLDLDTPASTERFMELITQHTTLSKGVVRNVQESELETLIGLLLEGRSVHTGIATYSPSINLEGELTVNVRVDKRILHALNAAGAFRGRIIHAENIGKNEMDLRALWDEANPDDLVEMQPGSAGYPGGHA